MKKIIVYSRNIMSYNAIEPITIMFTSKENISNVKYVYYC